MQYGSWYLRSVDKYSPKYTGCIYRSGLVCFVRYAIHEYCIAPLCII